MFPLSDFNEDSVTLRSWKCSDGMLCDTQQTSRVITGLVPNLQGNVISILNKEFEAQNA
jgi:hypothetical protein